MEGKRFESVSSSIDKSKASGAFVCEYEFSDLDSTLVENLQKYGYLDFLSLSQIWVEKAHIYKRKNLYFNEIEYFDRYNLIIQNPRELIKKKDSTLSMTIIKGEFPDFGIRKEKDFELVSASTKKYTSLKIRFGENSAERNRSGADRHNFSQRISTASFKRPKNEISVWLYYAFMTFQVDDEIIGKLKLKNKGDISKNNFVDPRPWWKKIRI
ncbi:hypothetical protein [uncultured Aquimarina sp.]|uniref:hypothetical protein n=1 Tax=uncultured Aquimarina sp. TaxID=575652 RepID=UPI00260F02EC|nr:hypothetical protein [uncultured Aquimarina sp.]